MSFDVTSNADEVANALDGVVDAAVGQAAPAAADLALALVDPRTPRRSGRLAAGNRVVVAGDDWTFLNSVPYASVVDARTGFASKTLQDNEQRLADLYGTQLQTTFDTT